MIMRQRAAAICMASDAIARLSPSMISFRLLSEALNEKYASTFDTIQVAHHTVNHAGGKVRSGWLSTQISAVTL